MLSKLKYLKALSIIKEIPTEGHSPLLILADDYEKYYIKSTKDKNPCYDILNEFICYYLLKIWQIPVPEIAAIKVNPSLIENRDFTELYHKKYYYEKLTFGSLSKPKAFEMSNFFEIRGKVDFKKFINPDTIIKIGLFDIWVDNTDRKPSNNNIIFQYINDRIKIYAIDNAFTFCSMDYESLNPQYISNTFDENILETKIAKRIVFELKKEKE